MPDLKHSTKKVLSRASTRKKTINKGLNQEFVDSRRRLHDISESVKSLKKAVHSNRQVWTAVAKHQRDFTKTLASSFPQEGGVQAHADEVETLLRNVQELLNSEDVEDAPHQRIVDVLESYLKLLELIEVEYKQVETAFTEKLRYEKKVDKLEKKKTSNANTKLPEKLTRNLTKMAEAQGHLDDQVRNLLMRMRSAFDKHEAVLQCAHHAYWMANHSYLKTIEHATHDIRGESLAVHNRLLSIDVQEDKSLTPIPRIHLIEQVDLGQPESVTVVVDSHNNVQDSIQHASSEAEIQTNSLPEVPTNRPYVAAFSKVNTASVATANLSPMAA